MRKTAIYFGLGGAMALALGACAPDAADETGEPTTASDVPEDDSDPVDERSDDDGDSGDNGDDSDDRTGPGDRTTPDENDDMTPTGTDDRRAAE